MAEYGFKSDTYNTIGNLTPQEQLDALATLTVAGLSNHSIFSQEELHKNSLLVLEGMAKAEAFKTLPTTPFASDIPAAQIAKNLGIVTPEGFESYKETANFNTYLQDVSTGKDAYENINITTGIYEVDNDPYFSWYSTHTGLNDLYSQGEVWATGTPISGSGGLENLALNDVKTYLDLGLDDDIWLNGVQVQTSNLTAEQKTLAQET